jgi:hypothetical protein
MPVVLRPGVIDKLFYLQRMTGQAPFVIQSKEESCVYSLALPGIKEFFKTMTLDGPSTRTSRLLQNEIGDYTREAGGETVLDLLNSYVFLSEMIRGLLRGAGRNELAWVQVDPTTMKKQLSGSETTFFRFFQEHPLAEKELLFVIVSFLV